MHLCKTGRPTFSVLGSFNFYIRREPIVELKKRATNVIKGMEQPFFEERLKMLGPFTLERRRLRGKISRFTKS